ncbi:MAG: NAD(P)-binding domain-containing protein [Pseudomonadota bacterium]
MPEKVCIIGAGCSGFTMAKRLKDFGVVYDCFEMSDDIGGNWYYNNPNGASSCYQSLHIDTSKWRLAFEDFPVPEDWPDFPHHAQLLQYFHDYVDHFDLRETITFNTKVETARRVEGEAWDVTLSTGETRRYRALIVANGHHWDPRIPDEYPGEFDGYQIHSHNYRDPFEPYDFRGKNVLIVGAGNSAMDIASELSQRPIAKRLMVSMRRGVWVLPKYIDGQPADKAVLPAWMPQKIGRALARQKIKKTIGNMEDYGLPKPDHEPLDAHPSVSGEFLTRVGCGDIVPKGAMERLEADAVVFADGSREPVDAIIWATGYKVSFPFFDDPELTPKQNQFPLFKRMVRPEYNTLYFLGLAQPLPTLVNFAEQQSKLVAAHLSGSYELPGTTEMKRVITADEAFHKSNFYDAPRHTMQVDFNQYVTDLRKELQQGTKRRKVLA